MDISFPLTSLVLVASFISFALLAVIALVSYRRIEQLVSRLDFFERNVKASAGTYSDLIDKRLTALENLSSGISEAFFGLTERLHNLNGILAEHAEIKTSLQEFRQQTLESLGELIGQIKLSTAQAENAEFDAAHDTDIPKDASGDIALTIYSTHQLVEAFKNDLITQVRLSREDYEELMAAAESKNADFPQQLNDLRLILTTLQTELAEFRQATGV